MDPRWWRKNRRHRSTQQQYRPRQRMVWRTADGLAWARGQCDRGRAGRRDPACCSMPPHTMNLQHSGRQHQLRCHLYGGSLEDMSPRCAPPAKARRVRQPSALGRRQTRLPRRLRCNSSSPRAPPNCTGGIRHRPDLLSLAPCDVSQRSWEAEAQPRSAAGSGSSPRGKHMCRRRRP
jgi:hypothetical protein